MIDEGATKLATEFLGNETRALCRGAAPSALGLRLRFVTLGFVFPEYLRALCSYKERQGTA